MAPLAIKNKNIAHKQDFANLHEFDYIERAKNQQKNKSPVAYNWHVKPVRNFEIKSIFLWEVYASVRVVKLCCHQYALVMYDSIIVYKSQDV